MSVNDEFDLANDLGIGEPTEAPTSKKPAPKKAAAKEVKPVVDKVVEEVAPEAPPKPRKVRIMIDEIAGMSNYEVVGVNGVVYQIKRGVPVEVPPEVVTVLEHAQMTHVEKTMIKFTGEVDEVRKSFSAIPWRRV